MKVVEKSPYHGVNFIQLRYWLDWETCMLYVQNIEVSVNQGVICTGSSTVVFLTDRPTDRQNQYPHYVHVHVG